MLLALAVVIATILLRDDIPIPGRDESFGVLIDAQAMGDLAAFAAHDLPALRIDLGDDADAGLGELAEALAEALA